MTVKSSNLSFYYRNSKYFQMFRSTNKAKFSCKDSINFELAYWLFLHLPICHLYHYLFQYSPIFPNFLLLQLNSFFIIIIFVVILLKNKGLFPLRKFKLLCLFYFNLSIII